MSPHSQPHHRGAQPPHLKSAFPEALADDVKCEGVAFATDDEPTDLTLDAEEKAAVRMRQRLERAGGRFAVGATRVAGGGAEEPDRDREELDPRPGFDFRHLIPHVSIKTENC
jgi:hypothetical protein